MKDQNTVVANGKMKISDALLKGMFALVSRRKIKRINDFGKISYQTSYLHKIVFCSDPTQLKSNRNGVYSITDIDSKRSINKLDSFLFVDPNNETSLAEFKRDLKECYRTSVTKVVDCFTMVV